MKNLITILVFLALIAITVFMALDADKPKIKPAKNIKEPLNTGKKLWGYIK